MIIYHYILKHGYFIKYLVYEVKNGDLEEKEEFGFVSCTMY